MYCMYVRTYSARTYRCHGTRVPWYVHTRVPRWNTLYQKRLEIQAHRRGVVSIEDITVYHGSNSTAMSAARISTKIPGPKSSQACGPARAPAPASPPLGRSQWSYYHGTMVHSCMAILVPWSEYHGTRTWYRGTYTCTKLIPKRYSYHGTVRTCVPLRYTYT